ncbi:hypothetical protein MSPP1_002021 [Malassezia sp. CBS 17886]|nr:hypothetical protein MSPP1_002021 [Malassezia sp. CBS 17886]
MTGPVGHTAKKAFNWKSFPMETYPIIFLCGCAAVGSAWYLTRLARGPEVIWDKKHNPTPWNNIEPGTQVKLLNITGDFDKKYHRDRL